MLIEVMRHLLWRRRVGAVHAWRNAEREEYERAVARFTALTPTGMGTRRRPRS
jgi:hypothetical protein